MNFMNLIISISLGILTIFVANAQNTPPAFINYQAVAHNDLGITLQNQNLNVKISILTNTASGNIIYKETHAVTTNSYGLFNLKVGTGNVNTGTFNAIPWADSLCYMKIEIENDQGMDELLGIDQLGTVPYAFHAKTANTVLFPTISALLDNNPLDGRFTYVNEYGMMNTVIYGWKSSGNDIYSTTIGHIGIGTTTPSASLDLQGTLQYEDGTQGAGKILTSDISGNATWAKNSIYYESSGLNNIAITADTSWQSTGSACVLNKTYSDSKIEVTLNSRIFGGTFNNGASSIKFEVRIDGNVADFDNQGAITQSNTTEIISIFAVFEGLSTGSHIIDIYTKTNTDNSSSVQVDSGGYGGRLIVKETF